MKIFPSLISSPLLTLEKTIHELNACASGYHIDIMDDHFVPNLTWGADFVHAIQHATPLPLHIHLMVDNPLPWLTRLQLRHNDVIIFHQEAFSHTAAEDFIEKAQRINAQIGIALNPETSPATIQSIIQKINLILIMSVHPGFSGQSFIPDVLDKIPLIRSFTNTLPTHPTIVMDGGINTHTIQLVARAGIDHVAIASALFSSSLPFSKALEQLKHHALNSTKGHS